MQGKIGCSGIHSFIQAYGIYYIDTDIMILCLLYLSFFPILLLILSSDWNNFRFTKNKIQLGKCCEYNSIFDTWERRVSLVFQFHFILLIHSSCEIRIFIENNKTLCLRKKLYNK